MDSNSIYENGSFTPQNNEGVSQKKGNAVASLVLGICSVVCCGLGFILGVIGLINGIVGLKKKQKKGMSITGVVLSSIGILLGIIVAVATVIIIVTGGTAAVGITQLMNTLNASGDFELNSLIDDFDEYMNEDNRSDSFNSSTDVGDAFKQELMEKIAENTMNSFNEKISSDEGFSFTDQDGNTYTIKGDSIGNSIITNDTTGEQIDIGEALDELYDAQGEIMTQLEEYGITQEDIENFFKAYSDESGMEIDPEAIESLLNLM